MCILEELHDTPQTCLYNKNSLMINAISKIANRTNNN